MRAISIKSLWPFRYDGLDPAVLRDADRLIEAHGDKAYETAGLYSWREDIGLLYTAQPGHWARVRLEIGHRQGQLRDPDLEGTSTVQRLHLM